MVPCDAQAWAMAKKKRDIRKKGTFYFLGTKAILFGTQIAHRPEGPKDLSRGRQPPESGLETLEPQRGDRRKRCPLSPRWGSSVGQPIPGPHGPG